MWRAATPPFSVSPRGACSEWMPRRGIPFGGGALGWIRPSFRNESTRVAGRFGLRYQSAGNPGARRTNRRTDLAVAHEGSTGRAPLEHNNILYLASRTNRLYKVDMRSGTPLGVLRFSQSLLPPALPAPDGNHLMAVGNQEWSTRWMLAIFVAWESHMWDTNAERHPWMPR